jgi:quercetin dioxygenase-like cupin family protein
MRERLLIAVVLVAAVGIVSATALGTTGSGTSGTTPFRASMDGTANINTERIKLQTKGPTDVVTQTVTYAPGAYSGWHQHPGVVLVSVAAGAVTRQFADCSYERHPAGTSFIENGEEQSMELRNLSATDNAVLYVTWVIPDGGATRADDPVDPGCAIPPAP